MAAKTFRSAPINFEGAGPSLPDARHVQPGYRSREAGRPRSAAPGIAPQDRQKRSRPQGYAQGRWQVKLLLAGAILLCSGALATARPVYSAPFGRGPAGGTFIQAAHPAVARIVAPGRGSISYGSGTLVAVNEKHGLVITNWHVINEAVGPVVVVFPGGFRSAGTVQKYDRDWDLAAIAIWRPPVEPVPLAMAAPQSGELLTIAGYGSGNYRAASGRCTQYVAPGRNLPFEMVELAASARQGDSGGPILNNQGELAGVLFGAGGGRTAGSYCGRVRWFLADVVPAGQEPPQPSGEPDKRAIASAPVQDNLPLATVETGSPQIQQRYAPPRTPVVASLAATRRPATAPAGPSPSGVTTQQIGWHDLAGISIVDQGRTVLAIVGSLAILLQTLRWLGA